MPNMALKLTSLQPLIDHGFDDIIDVRSPAEFAEDHVPGAINLPVLNNEERARVGTIYVQESRFEARKIGAALAVRNSARHLETVLADHPREWHPLVYCWRGGQRSGSFAWLLGQVGWKVELLDGGYRAFRRAVKTALYDAPIAPRLVVLEGMTCTGKTALLAGLAKSGMQVIDLEALAGHRGSVFGGLPDQDQPSQKWFETGLAMALARCDPTRPVVVEAESSKIGQLNIPPSLWSAMLSAPRLAVEVPLEARAEFALRSYPEFACDAGAFSQILQRLVSMIGHASAGTLQALV
ncbi:MAG: tRNA 2-selenouridine(34) synthase MnmH, partial [Mangrovicoccus sp.]